MSDVPSLLPWVRLAAFIADARMPAGALGSGWWLGYGVGGAALLSIAMIATSVIPDIGNRTQVSYAVLAALYITIMVIGYRSLHRRLRAQGFAAKDRNAAMSLLTGCYTCGLLLGVATFAQLSDGI